MAAYLETKALAVGYHGKPLIEDVALHVQRGKIVTLIGPNGSGKSTILKTIIGQLSKVSGTVFLDGKAMEERSRNEIARRMAILMTARMEPELMTCRDVVSSGRYPYTGWTWCCASPGGWPFPCSAFCWWRALCTPTTSKATLGGWCCSAF